MAINIHNEFDAGNRPKNKELLRKNPRRRITKKISRTKIVTRSTSNLMKIGTVAINWQPQFKLKTQFSNY